MDDKAQQSVTESETPNLVQSQVESQEDDPGGPGGGESGTVESVSLAARVSAGWRWASLPLAPLLVFLAYAIGLTFSLPTNRPLPRELERIETRATYPSVAWGLEESGAQALISATVGDWSDTGAVVFTSNETRVVTSFSRPRLLVQADPRFDEKNPSATWPLDEPGLDADANIQLRLGDAADGGILTASEDAFYPSRAYRLFGSGVHLFYATVYGKELVFQEASGLRAPTTPMLIANAATVALLKADRRNLNKLLFVPGANSPVGFGSFLRPQQWIETIAEAVERTAPHLRSINEVYIIVPPRSIEISQAGLRESPSLGASAVQAELNLPSPSLVSRLAANLTKALAVSLPWQNAAEIFPLRALPSGFPLTVPGQDGASATLNPDAINPIYKSAGRTSFLPAVAFFLCFGFVLVWSLRREQPGAPALTEIAKGGLVGILLAIATIAVLQFFGGEWLYGVDLTGIADLDAAGLLGGATLAAGLGGMLTGRVSFAAARPPREVEPPPEGEKTDGSSQPESRLRAVLFRDVPVTDRAGDHLGFGALVDALASFLDNRRTEPPLVLAVNGPWGSGKSSIMLMLQNTLEKTGRFRTATFNAWKYQKQEQILAAFLKEVADQLSEGWGFGFSFRLAWIRVKEATFLEFCTLSAPIVLLITAVFAPDILTALGLVAVDAAKTQNEQIAALPLATKVVSGGGGLGMLLWLTRFFLPFRVSYRKLFSVRDVGQHIGFLDQFEREFRYYRQVVGDDKLLIMIDDLDRCHPDAVVEVLKTINLIVTSDTGKGKTFFVLGFDPRFIIRSIEHHFKEFAKLGDVVDGRFGPQYLKKIVTIAVSVPKPDGEALTEMVENLSEAGTKKPTDKKSTQNAQNGASQAKWEKRIGEWSTLIYRELRRPVSVFAAGLVIVLALVLWSGGQAERGQDVPLQPAGAADGAAGSAAAVAAGGAAGGIIISPPDLTGRGTRPAFSLIESVVIALALFGTLIVLARAFGTAAAAREAPPEPDDSEDFVEAVLKLESRMPQNPRDVVRVVNRMRMAYVIQAKPPSGYKDPFAGVPLDAKDAVMLTLLQQKHPRIFDPNLLENLSTGGDGAAADVSGALDKLETDKGPLSKLATDFKKLMADDSAAKDVLGNSAKLKRFLAVNRFLLQRYEMIPEEESENGEQNGKNNKEGGNKPAEKGGPKSRSK